MTRLLLITLLMLSSGPAYAEWVEVGTTDDATIYFDPETIRRDGDRVKMWRLFNYKNVKTVLSNSSLSSNAQDEYDCAEVSSRNLALTFFSGHMGTGKVNHTESVEARWQPVRPGSAMNSLWKLVCDKK